MPYFDLNVALSELFFQLGPLWQWVCLVIALNHGICFAGNHEKTKASSPLPSLR